MSGLGHPESWNTGLKEYPEYHQVSRLLVHLGVLCSDLAEPPVRCLKGPVWLESPWGQILATSGARIVATFCQMLQKPLLKKLNTTLRVGELRFITQVGPEKLTLEALSLEQRGYRVFIHRQA